MFYECQFCHTPYSTRGGRTRHLHSCWEKKKREKEKHERELREVRQAYREKEKQKKEKHERELREARQAAKQTVIHNHVTYNTTNITNINIMTQKQIDYEAGYFKDFSERLMVEINSVGDWTSTEKAIKNLGCIKQKIQSSSDADKKICEWLQSDEVSREDLEEVDNLALLNKTISRVDEIELRAIKTIASKMPKEMGEKFRKIVGIFA